jgi:formylglycine-generating enzyme required for sulfatase activity
MRRNPCDHLIEKEFFLPIDGPPGFVQSERARRLAMTRLKTRLSPLLAIAVLGPLALSLGAAPPDETAGSLASSGDLFLQGGRVKATVSWRSQYTGQADPATALPQTDQFGYFYFTDPSNPEVFVKVLDFGGGRPYLVFYGGLTDFEYTVTFTVVATSQTLSFTKPAGSYEGGADNKTLATICSPGPGGCGRRDEAGPAAAVADSLAAASLDLSKGHVRVGVTWRSQYTGQTGTATALPQTDQFGYFYFTDPNNPEVFVKVLDFGFASPYLLFWGGLTDYEYTVTFTNIETGQSASFHKQPGTFTGGADNSSLPHAPCVPLTATPALGVSAVSSTSINVGWGTVDGAAGYKLYRNGTLIYIGTNLSMVETGLPSGVQYCYTVRAYTCADAPLSAPSCVTLCAPPVSAPALSPVATSSTSINVGWGAVSGATGYRLYRNGTLIYNGANLSMADAGLTSGTQYCYTVRAYNTCADGPLSAPTCATTQTGPNLQEITLTLPGGVPLVLVKIPGGTFQMGSPESERGRNSDETQHEVTLTGDYYIGKYLVMQAQWQAVMGTAMPSTCGSYGIGPAFPVYCISWNDIAGPGGFNDRLNALLNSGPGGAAPNPARLPTEAEWERAARGGALSRFSFGDALDGSDGCTASAEADPYVWYCGNTGGFPNGSSRVVGLKQPNPYGLYDMHGLMWEWVKDWYGVYPAGPVTDPTGPATGAFRILRGGGWASPLEHLRSARRGTRLGTPNFDLGFRVAQSF